MRKIPIRKLYWAAVDATDEWAHRRHLVGFAGSPGDRMWSPSAWYLAPFRWLCEHRERGILGKDQYRATYCNYYFNGSFVDTSANNATSGPITWTWNQNESRP